MTNSSFARRYYSILQELVQSGITKHSSVVDTAWPFKQLHLRSNNDNHRELECSENNVIFD